MADGRETRVQLEGAVSKAAGRKHHSIERHLCHQVIPPALEGAAKPATFLVGDGAVMRTGNIEYVDAGYRIVG